MTPRIAPTPRDTLRGVKVRVKLFAALREQAGTRERELELADGAAVDDVWPALGLGDEPAGLVYAVNRAYAEARRAARGRRRGRAHPAGLRRRVPPLGRAALAGGGRARGRTRRRRGDRDLRRHDARAVARPRGGPARVRGVRGDGRGGDGAHRRRAAGAPRRDRRRDPPSRRPRRDRRDERRDRRLRRAPRRGLRRLPRPRSTPSSRPCRSGRRSCTSAARSGSGKAVNFFARQDPAGAGSCGLIPGFAGADP